MMNFFLKASANEVVPMLRRMEAAIAEGKTVQQAYALALRDTRMLRHLVGEPAPGLPFGPARPPPVCRSARRCSPARRTARFAHSPSSQRPFKAAVRLRKRPHGQRAVSGG